MGGLGGGGSTLVQVLLLILGNRVCLCLVCLVGHHFTFFSVSELPLLHREVNSEKVPDADICTKHVIFALVKV